MTDTAREAPKMTERDVQILRETIYAGHPSFSPECGVCVRLSAIYTLVLSLSTGEADTYDPRSEVKVKREEYEAYKNSWIRQQIRAGNFVLSESTPAAASTPTGESK